MSDETYQPKEPAVEVVPSAPEGPPKESPVTPSSVVSSAAPKVDAPAQVAATAAVDAAGKSYGSAAPAPQAPSVASASLMSDSAGGKSAAPQADRVSAASATDSAGRPIR